MGFISVRTALAVAALFTVMRGSLVPAFNQGQAYLQGSIGAPCPSCDCTGRKSDQRKPEPAVVVPVEVDDDVGATRGAAQSSRYDFGLVMAHCTEDYISWIDDAESVTVPVEGGDENERKATNWDVAVYERCDSQEAPEKFRRFQRNYGSEECTAYLKYIIDNYHSLPEVVYFLQSDAIVSKGDKEAHTGFATLQEMVDASAPLLATREKRTLPKQTYKDGHRGETFYTGYVNVGNGDIFENKRVDEGDTFEVLNLLNEMAPPHDQKTLIKTRAGACFGVRKESILRNSHEFYKSLFLQELNHEDVRDLCYALELVWHVVFGLPYNVPDEMLFAISSRTQSGLP